jgi:uncharacterized protein (TIGR03437 family)
VWSLLLLAGGLAQANPGFPFYSTESIVNSAAGVPGFFAPNAFLTIYGTNLATGTHALTASEIRDGVLPTVLTGSTVRVLVNAQPAHMYYASPSQINVLVPTHLAPGPAVVQVANGGRAGPAVVVRLEESAPALFETGDGEVIAAHLDGSLVTAEAPAEQGEIVVLYATGLGPTQPLTPSGRLAEHPARLVRSAEFAVWLNGVAVPGDHVLYAGVAPGYAGVFQVNFRIPAGAPTNPEIRIGTPARMSPPGRRLRVR